MDGSSKLSKNSQYGENFLVGEFTIIKDQVEIGKDVKIGNFCVIHENVKIGDNVDIRDYVELRSGTVIGNDTYIDSRVSSSGNCKVGNKVTIRYDTILARGVEIGDGTYVCPRVMTNNLDTEKTQIGGAKIGANSFIGTNAVIQHGIHIAEDVVIGSMSFVNHDCPEKGVYVGIPARKIK
ncbi:MAG TPA: hypothetical protein DHU63_07175 [Candidatus Marinimicrobia bacterium]|nr:MAG: hypothetical protein AUJ47_06555 [Candidatus Marinimicrobia bacterium CG1_02_48_14]HCW76303.1 hypothetical protein [Candidatus Neomarinimicrobiota bacterium]